MQAEHGGHSKVFAEERCEVFILARLIVTHPLFESAKKKKKEKKKERQAGESLI